MDRNKQRARDISRNQIYVFASCASDHTTAQTPLALCICDHDLKWWHLQSQIIRTRYDAAVQSSFRMRSSDVIACRRPPARWYHARWHQPRYQPIGLSLMVSYFYRACLPAPPLRRMQAPFSSPFIQRVRSTKLTTSPQNRIPQKPHPVPRIRLPAYRRRGIPCRPPRARWRELPKGNKGERP